MARAEFHRAVRRLHLSGVSLRELAATLGLSHQRVHQIVEAAGGSRRWRRPKRRPSELACSFCARPQRRTRRLVAGPGVYSCENCVALAETVISSRRTAETTLGPVQPVPDSAPHRRCSFCGKYRRQLTGLATSVNNPTSGKVAGDAAICAECLALCREIHAENLA
jgi:hypothetical protein